MHKILLCNMYFYCFSKKFLPNIIATNQKDKQFISYLSKKIKLCHPRSERFFNKTANLLRFQDNPIFIAPITSDKNVIEQKKQQTKSNKKVNLLTPEEKNQIDDLFNLMKKEGASNPLETLLFVPGIGRSWVSAVVPDKFYQLSKISSLSSMSSKNSDDNPISEIDQITDQLNDGRIIFSKKIYEPDENNEVPFFQFDPVTKKLKARSVFDEVYLNNIHQPQGQHSVRKRLNGLLFREG